MVHWYGKFYTMGPMVEIKKILNEYNRYVNESMYIYILRNEVCV